MKTRKRILLYVLTLLFVLTAAGCGSSQKELDFTAGDNAEFVKTVAQAITNREDTPDLFYDSFPILYDLEKEPTFQPVFAMMYMEAQEDENDPSLVHYSCRIPGLVGTCFNMAFQTYYNGIWKYSKWVSAEGEVRVITDEEGKRRIDLSETSSAFSAYATMRYINPLVFEVNDVNLDVAMKDPTRSDVLNLLLNLGLRVYAPLSDLSEDEYAEEVLIPELQAVTKHMQDVRRGAIRVEGNRNINITHQWNASSGLQKAGIFFGILAALGIPTVLILVLIFSKSVHRFFKGFGYARIARNKNARYDDVKFAVEKMKYPKDKKLLREVALTNSMTTIRSMAIAGLPYPEERETLLKIALKENRTDDVDEAIRRLPYPEEREALGKAAMKGSVSALRKLPYPKERDLILEVAKKAEYYDARSQAVQMLPYPEERPALREIAKEDTEDRVRKEAQKKLSYEQDRDLLRELALSEKYELNREDILERLVYPEDQDILSQAAITGGYGRYRMVALKKLSYPENKDVFMKAALEDRSDENRAYALEKLTYPSEREILILAAENEQSADIRKAALAKLPYPQEKKTWAHAAAKDPDQNIRLSAVKKLTYRMDGEVLVQVAGNDSSDDLRREALKKIPPAKEKELFTRIALQDTDPDIRYIAVEKLSYPEDRDVLLQVAKEDSWGKLQALAIRKIPYLEEPDIYTQMVVDGKYDTDDDKIKCSIALARKPRKDETILRYLCNRIQGGMKAESDKAVLTMAGWSAAALGRILTQDMKPEEIEENRKRLVPAIDRHNELVEKIRELQQYLQPYEGRSTGDLRGAERSRVENWIYEINNLQWELEKGIGNFMLDNGDMPFSYLTHILYDNQARIPRFIKQGIIMGLVDWLGRNASHPKAKELLENVIAIRADIIRSDNDLSFFELRVPSDSTREEYATLLADVLHCANPAVTFADPAELLSIAEQEVPGCMEMLRVCPLRLIDPVNRQTMGFYKFRPYVHAMWIQFQPPEGTGKVISRYHEVDDRTRPLSSGLNLQLFRDPYAVIPTIFHEFQHFKGDPNEASVFLKTQMFSIRFYRKYREANARADNVFTRMTDMLGLPPEADKVEALNSIIRDCYGVQISREEAEKHANSEIGILNMNILKINMKETWDKQVTFPQFADGQDEKNRDLIRDILIRFDTVPKSITREEFGFIVNQ